MMTSSDCDGDDDDDDDDNNNDQSNDYCYSSDDYEDNDDNYTDFDFIEIDNEKYIDSIHISHVFFVVVVFFIQSIQ